MSGETSNDQRIKKESLRKRIDRYEFAIRGMIDIYVFTHDGKPFKQVWTDSGASLSEEQVIHNLVDSVVIDGRYELGSISLELAGKMSVDDCRAEMTELEQELDTL